MQLLIHHHGIFNFVVVEQQFLCFIELLLKHCKLALNSEILQSISLTSFFFILCHNLVDLSQICRFSNISQSSIAMLGHAEVLFL